MSNNVNTDDAQGNRAGRLRFAVICASNQNRSMEAHRVLSRRGFCVCSYGTGKEVRLPGPSKYEPNVYQFGTPYESMSNDLQRKDTALYTRNGLLQMLDRNLNIKQAPQRFQDNDDTAFDVIITCEEKCFDAVCEEMMQRGGPHGRIVHVVNVEIRDTADDATIGARAILQLAQKLEDSDDMQRDFEHIIEDFQAVCNLPVLHTVLYQ